MLDRMLSPIAVRYLTKLDWGDLEAQKWGLYNYAERKIVVVSVKLSLVHRSTSRGKARESYHVEAKPKYSTKLALRALYDALA